jgi:hypothetical protein
MAESAGFPGMTKNDRIGFLTKETFMAMSPDEKWGVWFDYMVGNRVDQKDRCAACYDVFDRRYEPKRSTWWKAGYLTLMAVSGAIGGFFAVVIGYPRPPGMMK